MPQPRRRINLITRVIASAALVAFAIYMAQQRKAAAPPKPASSASSRPFVTDAPSSEGTKRFAWVPAYPGAELRDITSRQTHDQLSYGFSFHSTQNFREVLEFYRQKLQAAGFEVQVQDKNENGGEVHADAGGGKRSLDVIAAKVLAGGGAEIGVTAVER